MIDEAEVLLAEIRKYDPGFSPRSTGKYLLTELQSRHLDYEIKHKKRPKYKHRFANSIERHW
ncbi:Hypothetical protein FORC57_1238 [Listeria monocytogenes]|uniref:hypothetical protein n=1 Tax=Listeria monocytogenes TaxID=1639 RepID=UPI0005447CC1|nr:hypothetical protein [Listeria monocytogenes]EAG6251630.1 hypothetical protein [Listeria monocytogenes CFSAN003806]EIO1327578.1 hypothetical protein [Listeria innocua]AZU53079.1 Hypothetical protein FORC57_1238 [Listeria monocytogenes]EAA0139485.1 hypothetical protein [Listeria monocytogenes]EAA0264702.1 hypothetical protein [Listeria monocytogenes]